MEMCFFLHNKHIFILIIDVFVSVYGAVAANIFTKFKL